MEVSVTQSRRVEKIMQKINRIVPKKYQAQQEKDTFW